VFLGNGDGTFQAKNSLSLTAGMLPFGIALADLNGDSKVDAVISEGDIASGGNGGFDVLTGNGDGTFTLHMHYGFANFVRGVALGNLNNDSNLDVVVSDLGDVTGKAWIATGDGAGNFSVQTPVEVSTDAVTVRSPQTLKLGDMDNDGKTDIVTCNSTSDPATNTISIIKTTTSGATVTFSATPTEIMTGKRPFDVLVGNYDGANKFDIIAANRGDNTIVVYLSDTAAIGTLTYATPASYPAGSGPIALRDDDIDGDGKRDIVVADFDGNAVTVLYGGGAGVFGTPTASRPGTETYGVGMEPISIVTDRFIADAKIDVATANEQSNNISVLINQR
jgi:hypothetical protein